MDKPTLTCFGFPRSGSTLVWRIARMVCEHEWNVVKTHEYDHDEMGHVPILICVRDFRDCFASLWHVMSTMPRGEVFTKMDSRAVPVQQAEPNKTPETYKSIFEMFNRYLGHVYRVRRAHGESQVLHYEKFVDNYDPIFEAIEKITGMKPCPEKRQEIINKVDRKSVLSIQAGLRDFSEYDTESWIHGQHIHNGTTGRWLQDIPLDYHAELQKVTAPYLKLYGYPV